MPRQYFVLQISEPFLLNLDESLLNRSPTLVLQVSENSRFIIWAIFKLDTDTYAYDRDQFGIRHANLLEYE